MKKYSRYNSAPVSAALAVLTALSIFAVCFVPVSSARAQANSEEDPNSSKFRLVACDGPRLPPGNEYLAIHKQKYGKDYVACDFQGLMRQVQRLLNVAIIIGVFAAIIGFCYAGGLYISGTPKNRTRAHGIFPKVAWGFIIMLSAWFIVYQILSWLSNNPGLSALFKM
jgi:hypothetical protein